MDDSEIIELLCCKDERAIAEMKQKYEKLLYHIAGKILSQREDVEECISEVYYAAWNSVSVKDIRDMKIYLCRLVKNFAVNRLEYNTAQKRNPDFSLSLDELADCIPDKADIEDNVSSMMLSAAISRFLRSEKEKSRKIFIRRYWYCDTLSEIAETYGINEKNAAVLLFRTRKRLKQFLLKEGYISES